MQIRATSSDKLNLDLIKNISDKHYILENCQNYLTDESKYKSTGVAHIYFPSKTQDVAQIIQQHFQSDCPITISGGRTGIVGGAVAEEGSLITTEKLNHFTGIKWDQKKESWLLRVQPGITLEELSKSLDHNHFKWLDNNKNLDLETVKTFEKESHLWFYPPDPTEKLATIGGTVATNASGSRSYLYGPTRRHITALEVVLCNGSIIHMQRGEYVLSKTNKHFVIQSDSCKFSIPVPGHQYPKLKCSAGYFSSIPMDLIDYFIGSEGTLGIITEIEIKLKRKPEMELGCIAFFDSNKNAIDFVDKLNAIQKKNLSGSVSVIEYFDYNSLNLLKDDYGRLIPENAQCALFFELQTSKTKFEQDLNSIDNLLTMHHALVENTWAATDKKELNQMTSFRHALPEKVNTLIAQNQRKLLELKKISTDFVVSKENFRKLFEIYLDEMKKTNLSFVLFGHIGEYHLHLNMIPKNLDELYVAKKIYMKCANQVIELNGTMSGEHGIGKLKKHLLPMMYSPDVIVEMKKIKTAFDPKGILGKNTLF